MTLTEQQRRDLATLSDKFAIANTLATHSRGVDRADYPLLRSSYADGAHVAYGFFTGPADTFCRILADAQKAGEVTLHRTSNMWIRTDGDEARSESYVTAYTQNGGEGSAVQRLIGGRYLDRHARTASGWRLTHRTYVLDWNLNWPATGVWPESDPSHLAPRGGHGPTDAGRTLLALWSAHPSTTPAQGGEMTDQDQALDRVLSKQAIHELGMAYCRAVDRGDEALLQSLFHPDATVVSGLSNSPASVFAKDIVAHVTGALASSFHSVANEWIEVDGDGAVGESYAIVFTLSGEAEAARQVVVGGRYLDRYERRQGAWKFASRVFVMDFNINQPSTAVFGEGMYASLTTRGGYKPDDPVFDFWSQPAPPP